jgi:hypothetical protein
LPVPKIPKLTLPFIPGEKSYFCLFSLAKKDKNNYNYYYYEKNIVSKATGVEDLKL